MTYLTWLNDSDGDGIPDDLSTRLAVDLANAAESRAFWSALLDLCGLIGLHTAALPFPIVRPYSGADDNQTVRLTSLDQIRQLGVSPVESIETGEEPGDISPCLSRLFSIDGMLTDRDGDLIPDGTRVRFGLPVDVPVSLGAALANLAARIGLESGGVDLPLTGAGNALFRVQPDSSPASLTATSDGWLASGDPDALAALINRIADEWPHITTPETGGVGYSLGWLRRALAGDGPEPRSRGELAWELQWSAQWEVDRLWSAFTSQLLAHLDPDQHCDLTILASEPLPVRKELVRRVERELSSRGFTSTRVRTFSAFKSGLSWLQEEVIPGLRGSHVARVRIGCKTYDAEESSLDRPTRWLQELFPGDEILARDLATPLDSIQIDLVDGQSETFVAEAFSSSGESIGVWTFTPLSHEMPFVRAIPDSGSVCVTTGGLIAEQDGRRVEIPVPTDLESFWAFWQDEVIPRALHQIDERGGARASHQPFFDRLEADVWMSEPNSRLGIRDENDSAAEALHEDIYFNTLDAIEMYGEKQTGELTSAPGAVLPVVHVTRGGAPHARVRMFQPPARPTLPYVDLSIRGLRLRDEELLIEVLVERSSPETLSRLIELASMPQPDPGSIPARVTCGETSVELRLPLQTLLASESAPSEQPTMLENIHGQEVTDLAASLASMPGITAWVEDYSYEGRPIPAIALHPDTPGRLRSPLKLAALKPSCLIVARHHANEISSTNTAFQLAWLCRTDPDWQALAASVNITIIPYENPDGAALHARLTSDPAARNWKHHPARYNALGTEFSQAFFDRNTRFGESRVRPALWRRFLPDAVVDNHGVPSHEWVQPFAGFGSPPRFRVSYWIPQALLYGIIGYVDDEEFSAHRDMAIALRDVVSEAVRNTDIGTMNDQIGRSYRVWGQERDPERFPGEFHNGMLWHIAGAPANPEGRGFSSRYPMTTVLNWVTEVNDETAEGTHLERTARAHLIANRAMLDLLVASVDPPHPSGPGEHGRYHWHRPRPLHVRRG